MVGLVIVSHSRTLSQALAELVRQVSAKSIPLVAVGGVGEDREAFGTDAVEIAAAVEAVYSAEGVVVLMDLGSALLSAETALELLPADRRSRVRLCAAPVVEGAVAAGVQIGLGGDLETVCREATRALTTKARHLCGGVDQPTQDAASAVEPTPPADRKEIVLTVNSLHGLHARPAARFVQTAAAFDARVWVKKVGSPLPPVSAVSLNSLATLGVNRGDRVAVSAAGAEAQQALKALSDLVNRELPAVEAKRALPKASPRPAADSKEGIRGIALSEGIALGPAFRYQTAPPTVKKERVENPEHEWADLLRARDLACEAIQKRRHAVRAEAGESEAAIFDAHILILRDPILLERARQRIFDSRENAAWAWQQLVAELAAGYRALTDSYLRQRAEDVADVGRQVLLNLSTGGGSGAAELPWPAILICRELTPSDVAELDAPCVLGIVTVAGGPTSHSAILARALGIPAIAGVDPAILEVEQNTPMAIDGFSGTVWVRPAPELTARLQAHRVRWLQERDRLALTSRRAAVTRDGRRVAVAANIGRLEEAGKVGACGADGVGLLRSEFLFMGRSRPPAEDEQADMLIKIARTVGRQPICVRTLDVGGDKPLAYLREPPEANPYLGMRAVRLSLRHPEIFRPQVRAILRAGTEGDLRLMFPMIATVEEVDRLIEIRDAVHRELTDEGVAHRWPIPTGIMVETPAAALMISPLGERLDFFSIGTNDLTQYTLAAERGNADLKDYADPLHPSVLRLIRQAVEDAHRRGRPVAVCGEMAADPAAVPVLIGLGIDELSVSPDAVPGIKALVRRVLEDEAVGLAEKMLAADSANSARRLSKNFLAAIAGSERFGAGGSRYSDEKAND